MRCTFLFMLIYTSSPEDTSSAGSVPKADMTADPKPVRPQSSYGIRGLASAVLPKSNNGEL